MNDVFIIGSKGIPANYGGFETFVDNLTFYSKNESIKYYVACMSDNNNEFIYNNTKCFNVKIPNIGSIKAILYDIKSIKRCYEYIKKNNIKNAVVYILACRIGFAIRYYRNRLKKLGAKVYVNPDGHEWKRSKWNWIIKKYWKFSERLMVKNADLLVCDSIGIENYIKEEYKSYNPKTVYIAYGAELNKSKMDDSDKKIVDWYKKYSIVPNEYYLIVCRFVPENNYETIIREFIKSSTNKDLVVITNFNNNNKFYNNLLENTHFDKDKRIKFVGTVYEKELIKKIRENAYAYIHGHEVGGTNPSLLEALASTKINLLYDVIFNKEVAADSALYFNKDENNLATLIENTEKLSEDEIIKLGLSAKNTIKERYSWKKIVNDYEKLFLNNNI